MASDAGDCTVTSAQRKLLAVVVYHLKEATLLEWIPTERHNPVVLKALEGRGFVELEGDGFRVTAAGILATIREEGHEGITVQQAFRLIPPGSLRDGPYPGPVTPWYAPKAKKSDLEVFCSLVTHSISPTLGFYVSHQSVDHASVVGLRGQPILVKCLPTGGLDFGGHVLLPSQCRTPSAIAEVLRGFSDHEWSPSEQREAMLDFIHWADQQGLHGDQMGKATPPVDLVLAQRLFIQAPEEARTKLVMAVVGEDYY